MNVDFEKLFGLALWLAGVGHFCILAASFQVPARLGWKEDLPKLRPFNRKLMWVYAMFMVLIISAFGALTIGLHGELLRGDRAALGLAGFIGAFWTLRILVDVFYYEHKDWPVGFQFKVGHFLLTSLFFCLASSYLGLIVWHLAK